MKTMDVKVYDFYKKYAALPAYVEDPDLPRRIFSNVPIIEITSVQFDAAILLKELEVIDKNRHCELLILTDRMRVLAAYPNGCSLVLWTGVIDRETARKILSMVR